MEETIDFSKQYKDWNDWKWQYSHRIKTVEALSKIITLSEQEKEEIGECLKKFRMAITPYYASLINKNDPNDPIRLQAVPSIKETFIDPTDQLDPLCEEASSPVSHLVHRYPDRVLLLVTYQCSMYCRHCTRRRVIGEEDKVISEKEFKNVLDYIQKHTEIRDVLISGGDPLTLGTKKLEHLISSIRAIPHVEIIRIGTRVPVVMPMRIDTELTDMLRKYHPIWLNVHFNHPNEITNEARRACSALADAGIPLGNQSVLLKGINDNPDILKELLLKLVSMRVRPYYLYQCDMSQGISHFRTSVDKGIEIMYSLQGNISGFAVPRYVIDSPGGGGKIPVNYQYIKEKNPSELILENYEGNQYHYPIIKD